MERRYGLKGKSVHWEPDEVPNHDQLRELKSILKDHPSKWMLWEGAPAGNSVAALDSMGVQSIVVSPCANRPGKMDFLAVMQQNIENIKRLYN